MANENAWLQITLREWVESQRHEQTPHRAALLTAIDAGDLATIRNLLAAAPFDRGQRLYLDDLLDRWSSTLSDRPGQ